MKLIATFLAAMCVSAHAYTPPSDQANGAYVVTFDEGGNAITVRLEHVAFEEPKPKSAKFPREPVERLDFPGQRIGCTGRDIWDQYAYSVVQTCLSNWLSANDGAWKHGVYYCRHTDTLLAVCNYGWRMGGNAGEVNNFNDVMDRTCGSWKSGWVWIGDWNKSYYRTTWGEEICGNMGGGDRERVGSQGTLEGYSIYQPKGAIQPGQETLAY